MRERTDVLDLDRMLFNQFRFVGYEPPPEFTAGGNNWKFMPGARQVCRKSFCFCFLAIHPIFGVVFKRYFEGVSLLRPFILTHSWYGGSHDVGSSSSPSHLKISVYFFFVQFYSKNAISYFFSLFANVQKRDARMA